MEAADTLYGVSMGGDGVSKVVSRKLPKEYVADARGGAAGGRRRRRVACRRAMDHRRTRLTTGSRSPRRHRRGVAATARPSARCEHVLRRRGHRGSSTASSSTTRLGPGGLALRRARRRSTPIFEHAVVAEPSPPRTSSIQLPEPTASPGVIEQLTARRTPSSALQGNAAPRLGPSSPGATRRLQRLLAPEARERVRVEVADRRVARALVHRLRRRLMRAGVQPRDRVAQAPRLVLQGLQQPRRRARARAASGTTYMRLISHASSSQPLDARRRATGAPSSKTTRNAPPRPARSPAGVALGAPGTSMRP